MSVIIDGTTGITSPAIDVATPITTTDGGTGRTTNTAYAVICGGTTAGGAEQSIASVGTAGQILTSNGAGALPTFQAAGGSSFPSGTVMLFVQTAAPTGWTKSTSHNNKALRVVSGTASSGGTVAFTTAFASQGVSGTVGSTTLTTAQIPSHLHSITNVTAGTVSRNFAAFGSDSHINQASYNTNNTGGGGSHNHTFSGTAIDLAVQYVDVIIATKD